MGWESKRRTIVYGVSFSLNRDDKFSMKRPTVANHYRTQFLKNNLAKNINVSCIL